MVAYAHAFDYDAHDCLCYAFLERVVQLVPLFHEPAFRRPFHGIHKSYRISFLFVVVVQQGWENIL